MYHIWSNKRPLSNKGPSSNEAPLLNTKFELSASPRIIPPPRLKALSALLKTVGIYNCRQVLKFFLKVEPVGSTSANFLSCKLFYFRVTNAHFIREF